MSFLTIFVWRWAVRRPALGADASPGADGEAPISYVAIGASDVVGVGADDPDSQSWINVLHGMMPVGTRLTRLGRGGITLREALAVELPEAIAVKPDVVTMWNCVNDVGSGVALNDYLRDLGRALSTLTRETEATIFLLNLPDLSILLPPGAAPTQRTLIQGGARQWNEGIASTAAKFGDRVKVVDIFPISAEVLERPDYISPDGFHPSTSGYRRLAEVVWEAMRDR